MGGDSLGDRMKEYEDIPRIRLMRKQPVIVRLDGKAFHTLTRRLERPWDYGFYTCMRESTIALCAQVQGCQLAYTQSDEISLLLTDWATRDTSAWFDNNLQKIVSVSAAICAVAFSRAWHVGIVEPGAPRVAFDARAWNMPEHEVVNYFIWRQQDASRNSVSMLAQAHFSHEKLHGVTTDGMQDMLFRQKGINWNDCPVPQRRGVCVVKVADEAQRGAWVVDEAIPLFTADRDYIESRLLPRNF